MKIKNFENVNSNVDYYIESSNLILNVFDDFLSISSVRFLEDFEYNFKCVIRIVTSESYLTFKILFDIIEKHSSHFMFTDNECYAKINNIKDFCNEIKNVKL